MQNNPHIMYILRGIPGSGKSELMSKIVQYPYNEDTRVFGFEADMFMTDENGEYKFDPDKLDYAHRRCFMGAVYSACTGESSVVVSNTNISSLEYSKYIRLARLLGMRVQIISIDSDFTSIHCDNNEAMARMRHRWATAEKPRNVLNFVTNVTEPSLDKERRWELLCALCDMYGKEIDKDYMEGRLWNNFSNTYDTYLVSKDIPN